MQSLLVALVLLGVVSFAFPQEANPKSQEEVELAAKKANEAELGKRKTELLNLSSDLEGMMKSLQRPEQTTALSIDERAGQGVMYLDATIWFLALYDRMECKADRATAKIVLTNRLGFYSHMLDMAAEQTNGYLAFAHLPATAQTGQRIKDDLRAAKNKLDEIAASLK